MKVSASVVVVFVVLLLEGGRGVRCADVSQCSSDDAGWVQNTVVSLDNFGVDGVVVVAADLDGDNDEDFVVCCPNDLVQWVENFGSGSFGPMDVVGPGWNDGDAFALIAVDVDSDSDVDLLTIDSGNRIVLDVNLNDDASSFGVTFDQRVVVFNGGYGGDVEVLDLTVGDLDRDGDMDIIVSMYDPGVVVVWLENDGLGSFAPPVEIAGNDRNEEYILAVDMDGDGDTDVVSYGESVHWYNNTNRNGNFSKELLVWDGEFVGKSELVPIDINYDGFMDFAIVDSNAVAVLVSMSSSWSKRVVFESEGYISVAVSDIDNDGDTDLLVPSATGAVESFLSWLENENGVFRHHSVLVVEGNDDEIGSILPLDIDGDDDIDVAFTTQSVVVWLENTGMFSTALVIDSNSAVYAPTPIDIDRDGDLDVVAIRESPSDSSREAVWYENTDGDGTFSNPMVLFQMPGGTHIHPVDVDRDGDLDFVCKTSGEIVWFENVDGLAEPMTPRVLNTTVNGLISYRMGDIDGDAYVDIVLIFPSSIAWLRNEGGLAFDSPLFTSYHGIVSSLSNDDCVIVDLDRDGSMDIVSSGRSGSSSLLKVFWVRNSDGIGSFEPPRILVSSTLSAFHGTFVIVDWDGDGDLDVLDSSISLFENQGNEVFVFYRRLVVASSSGAILAADMDRDGDFDIVIESRDGLFLLTSNGSDSFSSTGISTLEPFSVRAADMDGDGLLDLIASLDSGPVWFRNQRADSNHTVASLPRSLTPGSSLSICTTSPFSFECIAARVASSTSVCTTEVVMLDPGVYSCSYVDHLEITRSVVIAAAEPGSVIFNCSHRSDPSAFGGVLFRVIPHPDFAEQGLVGDLELRDIVIIGTGVGTRGSFVSSGLRVEGSGSILTLTNCTIRFGRVGPQADLLAVVDEGNGGAVTVVEGATLNVVNSTFQGCSATNSGGAIFVRGATLLATNAGFEGNLAGVLGGALALISGVVRVTNSEIVENVASSGGAIACVSRASFLTLVSSSLEANTASEGSGGGLFFADSTGGSSLVCEHMAFLGNYAARTGGAIASVAPGASLALSGNSVLEGNVAGVTGHSFAVSSSADILHATSLSDIPRFWGPSPPVSTTITFADSPLVSSLDVFLCSSQLDVTSVSSTMSLRVLQCALSGVDPPAPPSSWIQTSSSVSLVQTTPPTSLQAVLPLSTMSGRALDTGVVTAFDAFGEVVVDPSLLLRASTSSDVVVLSGLETGSSQLGADSGFELGRLTLSCPPLHVQPTAETLLTLSLDGTVASQPATVTVVVNVTSCVPGFGSVTGSGNGLLVCAPCATDAYSDSFSASPCLALPECTGNTVDIRENGTRPVCVCQTGFTLSRWVGVVPICVPCPEGGVCAQGLGPPLADKGFYPGATNGTFVRCERKSACIGGTTLCRPAYEGYMCNSCTVNYYSDESGKCVACPKLATTMFVGYALAVVLVGVIAGAGVVYVHLKATQSPSDIVVRERNIPPSLSMILVAFQVVGILADANLNWSDDSTSMMSYFQTFFSLSTAHVVGGSQCSVGFFGLLALDIVFPFVLFGSTVVSLLVMKHTVSSLRDSRVFVLVQTAVFMVAPLLYIPVTRSTLTVFDCTRLPNGDYVLDMDQGQKCFEGTWWFVLPLAGVSVVAFVVGLPLGFGWILHNARASLLDPLIYVRYGRLYAIQRVPYYLMGVGDLIKRMLLVIAALFFTKHQLAQIGLLLGVMLIDLIFVTKYRPYFFPIYNGIHVRLGVCLIVLLFVGVASYAERANTGSVTPFLVGAVVVTLSALLCVSIHGLLMDRFQISRERNKRYSAVVHRVGNMATYLKLELCDLDQDSAGTRSQLQPIMDWLMTQHHNASPKLSAIAPQGAQPSDRDHDLELQVLTEHSPGDSLDQGASLSFDDETSSRSSSSG